MAITDIEESIEYGFVMVSLPGLLQNTNGGKKS